MLDPSVYDGKIRSLSWKERLEVLIETFKGFFAVKGIHHGAAMAYYALFAMVPLLYLSVSVFGRVIGKDKMESVIQSVLTNQIGIKDVEGIMVFVSSLNLHKGNFIMDVVGIVTLLIACSALLVSLKNSMNKYMGIEVVHLSSKRAILQELLFRSISIVMLAGFTIVVIVVYFAQLFFVSIGAKWLDELEVLSWVFNSLARHGLSILSNLIIFTIIFRFVHDGVVRWKLAFSGAVFTSLVLYFSQLAIKYYLVNFFFAADGGIAGSILVIMLWVFYSSLIIFLGAKFTAVYAAKTGHSIIYK
jgi:membrane protein